MEAIKDSPEMGVTPPTRANRHFDLIIMNAIQSVTDSGVTSPLRNLTNTESDHRVVFATIRMPRVDTYSVRSYTYTYVSKAGLASFGEWLDCID